MDCRSAVKLQMARRISSPSTLNFAEQPTTSASKHRKVSFGSLELQPAPGALVEKMTALTKPAPLHSVDVSERKHSQLYARIEESGTLIKLNQNL